MALRISAPIRSGERSRLAVCIPAKGAYRKAAIGGGTHVFSAF